MLRLEGRAEAAQGRRGVELVDLPSNLLRDELPLEVCQVKPVSALLSRANESRRHSGGNLQCSCLPVRVWPGWGTLSCLSMRSGSSTVFVGGSTAPPSRAFAESPAAMTNRDDDE